MKASSIGYSMLAVVAFCSGCSAWMVAEGRKVRPRVMDAVPLGARLDHLEYVLRENGLDGMVMQWLPPSNAPPSLLDKQDGTSALVQTPYGEFRRRKCGDLSKWDADDRTRAMFAGTITTNYLPPFVGDSKFMEFTFINGKVVQKQQWNGPG